jgi:hypothetical protein
MESIAVMIETGKKRAFASALDWPGWSRNGRDEEPALQALADYGTRYGQILENAGIDFHPPADPPALVVVERRQGGAGTDFGAPEIPSEAEKEPLDQSELERFKSLLRAYWQAFDESVRLAEGKALKKGPRGGGRELEEIVRHVIEADKAYLRRLAWKPEKGKVGNLEGELQRTRDAILSALDSAVIEGLPEQGPRGGTIWSARYFVRRVAWHVLDHAWEIEDRIIA